MRRIHSQLKTISFRLIIMLQIGNTREINIRLWFFLSSLNHLLNLMFPLKSRMTLIIDTAIIVLMNLIIHKSVIVWPPPIWGIWLIFSKQTIAHLLNPHREWEALLYCFHLPPRSLWSNPIGIWVLHMCYVGITICFKITTIIIHIAGTTILFIICCLVTIFTSQLKMM